MKQHYIDKNFRADALRFIDQINEIIEEYEADGFVLTVRQLYYQLVSRAIIQNNISEYKRTASVVNDAKLAGLIDWDMLEDKERSFITRSRWTAPQSMLDACAKQYHQDMWDNQENRVFVVVEKRALVGVLEGTCRDYDVPLLAAKGYPSGSVLRSFGRDDLMIAIDRGQRPIVLHLGDHDPSGIDMTRDLENRINLFSENSVELIRIALNMEQIEQEKPPENPAKTTDSRFASYKRKYGISSWELDALSPRYLARLLSSHISRFVDDEAWQKQEKEITKVRRKLAFVAKNWTNIKQRAAR